MRQTTVSKEILINLGNFSNIKIIASITSDESSDLLWKDLNNEIEEQELYERNLRTPRPESSKNYSEEVHKREETKKDLPF